MIELFIIAIIIYGILASVAYFYAKRRKTLFWSDIGTPIFVILIWIAITAMGYGHQSLSQVIEVPIALMISLVIFNLRVFVIDKYNQNYKLNSYTALGISLIFVFLLRSFMPFIPE